MTNQIKHTPAPWEVKYKNGGKGNKCSIWIHAKEGCEFENGNKFATDVCRIVKSDGFIHLHEKTYMANARLIAAAPDLLKAAKVVWDVIIDGNNGEYTPEQAHKMLSDAISKTEV